MRRSASRRSRTLLLKARPPAMTSPPAMKRAEPIRGYLGGQGAAERIGRPFLVIVFLVLARHELEPAREAIHHEVVPRRVQAAVHQRGEHEEDAEHERSADGHLVDSPRTAPGSVPTACSQFCPSNARRGSEAISYASRQRRLTSMPSGCERGT